MISRFNCKGLIGIAFVAALLSPPVLLGVSERAQPSAVKTAPEAAKYTSFRNEEYELYAWQGENVAFLTRSKDLDLGVMDKLCQTFDLVYEYYSHASGRTPRPLLRTTYRGLSTVAEVTNTCGAGCGYLGFQGIELMPGAFRGLYEGVRDRNQYDQVLFYEFGRNFWFYANKIGYKKHTAQTDAIETGYAVFMRFMAAEVSGVVGGPYRGRSWNEFRREVEGMVDYYVDDEDLDWHNTIKISKAPKNPMNLGATDLFAGFLLKLYSQHGGLDYVTRLWHEVGRRPDAKNIQDAVDNLIISASIAAGENLSQQFIRWRWPVSDAAREEIDRRLNTIPNSRIPFETQTEMRRANGERMRLVVWPVNGFCRIHDPHQRFREYYKTFRTGYSKERIW